MDDPVFESTSETAVWLPAEPLNCQPSAHRSRGQHANSKLFWYCQ